MAELQNLRDKEDVLKNELLDLINDVLANKSTFELRDQLEVSDQTIRNIKRRTNSKNGPIKTETLLDFAEKMKKNSLF